MSSRWRLSSQKCNLSIGKKRRNVVQIEDWSWTLTRIIDEFLNNDFDGLRWQSRKSKSLLKNSPTVDNSLVNLVRILAWNEDRTTWAESIVVLCSYSRTLPSQVQKNIIPTTFIHLPKSWALNQSKFEHCICSAQQPIVQLRLLSSISNWKFSFILHQFSIAHNESYVNTKRTVNSYEFNGGEWRRRQRRKRKGLPHQFECVFAELSKAYLFAAKSKISNRFHFEMDGREQMLAIKRSIYQLKICSSRNFR